MGYSIDPNKDFGKMSIHKCQGYMDASIALYGGTYQYVDPNEVDIIYLLWKDVKYDDILKAFIHAIKNFRGFPEQIDDHSIYIRSRKDSNPYLKIELSEIPVLTDWRDRIGLQVHYTRYKNNGTPIPAKPRQKIKGENDI